MGSRLLYMLPALAVALVALILALVGLSRDPAPSLVVREASPEGQVRDQEAPSYRYWVVTESLNIGDTLDEEALAVVSSPEALSRTTSDGAGSRLNPTSASISATNATANAGSM